MKGGRKVNEFRQGGYSEFRDNLSLGEDLAVGGSGMKIGKKAVCPCAHGTVKLPRGIKESKGNEG